MSAILPLTRPMRRNKIAQDAPATIFSRGTLLWYPPISTTRNLETVFARQRHSKISCDGRRRGRCRPCGRKERAHKGLGKLHKPQFPTAPTPIILFTRGKRTTKNCKCANLIVSTEGFTPP
jgi:hypothetical protein